MLRHSGEKCPTANLGESVLLKIPNNEISFRKCVHLNSNLDDQGFESL